MNCINNIDLTQDLENVVEQLIASNFNLNQQAIKNNVNLQKYIVKQSRRQNKSREDIQDEFIQLYNNKMKSVATIEFGFDDMISKNEGNNQEDTSSQLSPDLTPAQRTSFAQFSKSIFKPLYWRFPKDGDIEIAKTIENDEDIDQAIRYVFKNIYNELADVFGWLKLNTIDSNFYETIYNKFNGINHIKNTSKYYNHYLVLTRPDTAITYGLDKRVQIPSGYFNILNDAKKYKLKQINEQAHTWTTDEEDVDDMSHVSKITKNVFESIPMYTYDKKSHDFKISDNLYLSLNDATSGFSLLQDFLIDSDDKNSDLFKQICNIRLNIKLLPDILKELFNKQSNADFGDTYINFIESGLQTKKVKRIESLYSIYKFLQKTYQVDGINKTFEEIFPEAATAIYQHLNSSTEQIFSTYEKDKNSDLIVSKDLTSNKAVYSLYNYSDHLRELHTAKNKWLNIDAFNINENLDIKITIPDTNIEVQVKYDKNNGLSFNLIKNGDSVNFNFFDKLSSKQVDANIKNIITPQELSVIIGMPNNEKFEQSISTIGLVAYKHALDIIRNHIANELIQLTQPNPDSIYGISIKSETDFNAALTKLKGNSKKNNSRQYKTYKDWWMLEMTDPSTFYDILEKVASVRDIILNIPTSTIVQTQERTQLNTNKLSQRGNLFYETTVEQRSNTQNPSSHFMLYEVFNGIKIIRDVKNLQGEVKRAIDFNLQEHLTAAFTCDFLNMLQHDKVSFIGPVVSDKSWIPRISTKLNKTLKLKKLTSEESLDQTEYNGEITLKDILRQKSEGTKLLREITCNELFAYYRKQKEFVNNQYKKLNEIGDANDWKSLATKYGVSIDSIQEFTSVTQWLQSSIGLKSQKQSVIHELVIISQKLNRDNYIEWVDNLCDCWRSNQLITNPLLEYNLQRYKIEDLNNQESEAYKWFIKASDSFISDLLRKNISLKRTSDNDSYNSVTSKDFALSEININIPFAQIQDGDSKRYISFSSDLKSWDKYKELAAVKYFLKQLNDITDSGLNIRSDIFLESPEFSITSLIEFIKSNEYKQLIRVHKLYKEFEKKSDFNEDVKYKDKLIKFTEEYSNLIEDSSEDQPAQITDLNIIFNPILENYNLLNSLVSEEYLNCMVGTYLTHPIKGKDTEEMLKNAIGAQVKRNVILSATKTQYLHGYNNTIPQKIKIGIIQNLSNDVFNILADSLKADEYSFQQLSDDGATFVDGAYNYLENFSLGPNAVGQDKKQFGSYINAKAGAGFILKTAGFALTNDLMRRSPEFYNLSKRNRSLPLTDPVDLNDPVWQMLLLNKNRIIKAIPTFQNGILTHEYRELIGMSTSDGNHELTWKVINEKGNDIIDPDTETVITKPEKVSINNTQDLWENVLGGMYSCKFASNGVTNQLTYNNCDLSNKILAQLMCTDKGQNIKSQVIAYNPTYEAVKYGAANKNTDDVYTADDNYVMSYMEIDCLDLGIQLDAEHSAFENRVSLMTQVMNAAAARGYSIKEGDEIYEVLHRITMLSIQDCFNSYANTDLNLKSILDPKAYNKIAGLILEALKTNSIEASNLLDVLSSTLSKSIQTDSAFDILRKHIPIDDPNVLRNILSKFTSSLQSNAVRLKFPGGQYVLAPSDGRIQLWAGKTLDQFGGKLTKNVIEHLKGISDVKYSILPNFGEIRLGHSYKYHMNGFPHEISLTDPKKYWDFKDLYDSGKIDNNIIYNDYTKPWDLGCEDFIFTDGFVYYHIWDLYEVRKQWELTQLLHKAPTQEAKEEIKLQLKQNQLDLQEQLNKLSDKDLDNIINIGKKGEDGELIKQQISFDKDSVKNVAFQAILPKYLKKRFNLTDFDNLSDIKEDKYFFYKRSLDKLDRINSLGKELQADLCLAGAEFNTYIKYADATTSLPGLNKIDDSRILLRDNTKWLLSKDGQNLKYEIPSNLTLNDVSFYENNDSGELVIVTKKINAFIDQDQHYAIYVLNNDTLTDKQELFDELKKVEDLNELFENDIDSETFWTNISNIQTQIVDQIDNPRVKSDNRFLQYLKRKGLEQRLTVIDSLKFIASRTPAQCHQSFMAMECVAFDHSDRNVAYVSRWQLWLQGSDFDIKQC